ncbi:coadhesin-like [Mytilus trossulus]|uniref:coadhesin-like n=1 Tax=Mytilus trossulus TaxID=6551 RepID=UPI003003DC53
MVQAIPYLIIYDGGRQKKKVIINGNYGEWMAWSSCLGSCKGGVQVRRRPCDSPAPANNGLDCSGKSLERRRCKRLGCPIRGKWGSWTDWTMCSASCDGGSQERKRSCDNPAPANNGPNCSGSGTESRQCAPNPCPINGDWGEWKEWSSCFGGCKNGRQRRRRTCDSPAPANNGRDCSGTGSQSRQCKPLRCPISGNWGSWKDWTMCSKTCGGGIQERSRSCDNPAAANNGPGCSGSGTESTQCASNPCPIAGNWGKWKDWTMCSKTCGGGIQERSRSCDSPAAANDGPDCSGSDTESRHCASTLCPINGNWGRWGQWNLCSGTCKSASRLRRRSCNKPAPANDGLTCSGSGTEKSTCTFSWCLNGSCSKWTCWTPCSVTCGSGNQERRRTCQTPPSAKIGPACSKFTSESKTCTLTACPIAGKWGGWKEWSMCSASCGGGHQTRVRACVNPAPANNGPDCSGSASEGRQCGKKLCPIAGKWGVWKDWSMCSVSCGGGHQTRVRLCDYPAPANNGPDCSGPGLEGDTKLA